MLFAGFLLLALTFTQTGFLTFALTHLFALCSLPYALCVFSLPAGYQNSKPHLRKPLRCPHGGILVLELSDPDPVIFLR